MRKAKTEIKIEPYPKGGWYVVERVNNKVWWKSSNYQSLELAETRKKEREELKTNMAKLLDKNTSRRQKKQRDGLSITQATKNRTRNARLRYLTLFNEYCKKRSKQPKEQRQNEFRLEDIRNLFGIQANTINRAISNREIKPSISKLSSRGRCILLFSYDDIKDYFEHLRGLQNGKPTSTMGTKNVQ